MYIRSASSPSTVLWAFHTIQPFSLHCIYKWLLSTAGVLFMCVLVCSVFIQLVSSLSFVACLSPAMLCNLCMSLCDWDVCVKSYDNTWIISVCVTETCALSHVVSLDAYHLSLCDWDVCVKSRVWYVVVRCGSLTWLTAALVCWDNAPVTVSRQSNYVSTATTDRCYSVQVRNTLWIWFNF